MNNFRGNVLIVDDDSSNLLALKKILLQELYFVYCAENPTKAIKLYKEHRPDLVISDMRMPEMSGLDLLKALRAINVRLPIIILTAFGTVSDAVEAMKLGAVDFLTKPIDRKSVLNTVQKSINHQYPVPSDSDEIKTEHKELIIGNSKEVVELRRTIHMIAPTKVSVLIEGESGTGKELVARAIHHKSALKGKMISINCAAIPESLLESELFGYEKGAFTGANTSKFGLFELADQGTLFLDEITELSLNLQSKLLRVLEDGSYFRLGSIKSKKIEVRVITATNSNINKKIEEGLFREDLFYRLNVIRLSLTPLRDRGQDLDILAQYYLDNAAKRYTKKVFRFTDSAMERMKKYHWPGNVRELVNVVERAVVLSSETEVDVPHIRLPQSKEIQSDQQEILIPLGTSLKEAESKLIHKTLKAMGGNKSLAAKVLGVNLRTIYRKLPTSKEP